MSHRPTSAADVLIVTGSPRCQGNCSVLIAQLLEGLGDRSAELITLHDLEIRPCSACRTCKTDDDRDCSLDDDMRPLYPKIRAADALVLASPIYWWNVSAQMKLFLDRCDALDGPNGSALRGKRVAVLLSHGGDSPESSGAIYPIGGFRDAAQYVGFDLVGIVSGTGWEPGSIREDKAAMAGALELGRALRSSLRAKSIRER